MKAKIKIINEYDKGAEKGKVNKTSFAEEFGLAKSSLSTILDSKARQLFSEAVFKKKIPTCLNKTNLHSLK